MSTENNSELLFDNSVQILTDLIAFKTISGQDNSSLIDYCDDILKKLGATSFRTYDDEKKRVNLFATLKAKISNKKKPIILSGPHRCCSSFKRLELRSFYRDYQG
jgi:acetylornithine deacetylase